MKLRLALAQVNPTVGDLAGNAALITSAVTSARESGADIVVFPEMIVTGYPVEDLALRPSFQIASKAMIAEIAASISGQIVAVVGYLDTSQDGAPQIAVAIIHEPKIVFLDEPTGGVDPLTRRQFWDLIYKASDKGITIFVTTHYMDEAEYCNRICIMVDGKIEALDSPTNLKKVFNTNSMDDVFYQLARGAKRKE